MCHKRSFDLDRATRINPSNNRIGLKSIEDRAVGNGVTPALRGKFSQDSFQPSKVSYLAADVSHVQFRHCLDLGTAQIVSTHETEQIADLIERET